jgi:hypothetical protein
MATLPPITKSLIKRATQDKKNLPPIQKVSLTPILDLILRVVSIKLPHSGRIHYLVPLYVFGTKIYHSTARFLQFRQILDLEPIDSESDQRDPLVSTDMANKGGLLLRWTGLHMSIHLKNAKYSLRLEI